MNPYYLVNGIDHLHVGNLIQVRAPCSAIENLISTVSVREDTDGFRDFHLDRGADRKWQRELDREGEDVLHIDFASV